MFFLIFPENKLWHCMQIVSLGDNLHTMSKLIFWKMRKDFICRLLKTIPSILSIINYCWLRLYHGYWRTLHYDNSLTMRFGSGRIYPVVCIRPRLHPGDIKASFQARTRNLVWTSGSHCPGKLTQRLSDHLASRFYAESVPEIRRLMNKF